MRSLLDPRLATLTLASLATFASLAACSAELEGEADDFAVEKPVALRGGGAVVKVPQHFADSVTVTDGKLLVARDAQNERVLDKLKAGVVVAGNRDGRSLDLRTSGNPSGFLRKVLAIQSAGDSVSITTSQAYLNELIDEGDLVFSDTAPGASIFEDAPVVTQGLRFAGPSGRSSGSGETKADTRLGGPRGSVAFAPYVTLSNTKVAMGAKLVGKIQLRRSYGVPSGIQRANLQLDLDPVLMADLEYGAEVSSAQSEVGGTLNETWEGPSVPIPIGGPIPLTLRLRPEVSCAVTIAGAATLTSRIKMTGHAVAGFDYRGGSDLRSTSGSPRFDVEHRLLGVRGTAGVQGECALQAVVSLLAFDALGIEAKIGPYGALIAKTCLTGASGGVGGGFVAYEQHGLRVDAQGRLQVPGLGYPSLSKALFGVRPVRSDPVYFLGSAETCALR